MNLKILGERIRACREKGGLKQADIAHALQISAQAVSKWERGENAPDLDVLLDLCKLLGVTSDWLLGRFETDRDTFPATVFCSDVTGFARRAAHMPPRELAAWANGIFHLVTEAVLRFEGVPVKYVGDGFLGFFSGPGHAERALGAAREARSAVPGRGLGLALHSGEIFLGAMGHRDYARPDIMGETVNTAFLVLAWAAVHGTSGLVATQATRSQLREASAWMRPRRVRIKGIAGPIEISRIRP